MVDIIAFRLGLISCNITPVGAQRKGLVTLCTYMYVFPAMEENKNIGTVPRIYCKFPPVQVQTAHSVSKRADKLTS